MRGRARKIGGLVQSAGRPRYLILILHLTPMTPIHIFAPVDLRQLEVFKLIVQTGIFLTAARKLGVTQSALSHQIRSLEEELGEQLLVRARPRTYPTAAGQRLMISTERIF